MKKFFRFLICVVGFVVLPSVVYILFSLAESVTKINPADVLPIRVTPLIYVASSILSGIIFIIFSKRITDAFTNLAKRMEDFAAKQSARTVTANLGGAAIGLFIAYLICTLFDKIDSPFLNVTFSALIYVVFGYMGMRIVRKSAQKMSRNKEPEEELTGMVKIIDTSAIIDGRIFDLCKTGIVEGRLVIPEFVLDELRHIADSADALKRAKGRKGLDALHGIQQESGIPVEIVPMDFEDTMEVDAKLLKLAQTLGGKIVTNDYNLNKVAAVKGVPVINVNDVSNAVKFTLAAGEELLTEVIKEGKEYSQGVGYLDDGTMIVIENGRKYIGKQLRVVVTSVLQTSAGRMIFAKPKEF